MSVDLLPVAPSAGATDRTARDSLEPTRPPAGRDRSRRRGRGWTAHGGLRTARRWAGPAATAGVLVVLVWRLGSGPFLAGLRALDGGALLAAAGIFLLTTVCAAWRWTIVSRGLGLRLTLPRALAAYYQAVFLNLVLPGGVAGDVHRGVSHGREVADIGRAIRAVVWERTAGQLVQAALALGILLALPSPVRASMPFVALAGAAVVIGVILAGRLGGRGDRSRWARVRSGIAADARKAVLSRGALPAVALTSLAVAVGHTAMFLLAARTTGVAAPVVRLLPLASLAILAMVLPSIGGWGPREGVTAWLFGAAGLGAGHGAATAVAYGVMVLAASLPGAVVLVIGRLPRRRNSSHRPRPRVVFRPEGAPDA